MLDEMGKWNNPGISPSIRGLDINLTTVFHRYSGPPAIISASFDNGCSLDLFVGREEEMHGVVAAPNGRAITSKSEARGLKLPRVGILPQVGPLVREEQVLDPDYVRRSMFSVLSSQHFRNELALAETAAKRRFKDLAESSWHGLRIRELHQEGKGKDAIYTLMVQNDDFVAEVGWMGHGLQMWLQTMWFIARSSENHETLILDEPDVYMHPDLQRKLVRLEQFRKKQLIVTTHSVEIIAEVDPEDVLLVDKRTERGEFATSANTAQRIVDHIGGVHNLQLVRLWDCRKCLLVEGDDIGILKHIQDALFPGSQNPFGSLPHISIDGWGGWDLFKKTPIVLKNAVGEKIVVYCLLDSDYHPADELLERQRDATAASIELYVWERKEIENYLLVPDTIARVISFRCGRKSERPKPAIIHDKLIEIASELREDTTDCLATGLHEWKRGVTPATANKDARARIAHAWESDAGKLAIVSGKEVLGRLSKWSKSTYNVSFSPATVARELRRDEISVEMQAVLSAIENLQNL
jgi:hypothetical protein